MDRPEQLLEVARGLRRLRDPIGGELDLVGAPALGDVTEAPHPTHARAADALGLRVALEGPPVLEGEDVEARRLGPGVQLTYLRAEGLRIRELLQHKGDRLRVVPRLQHRVRDAPQLGELAVAADDPAGEVHHQDPVRRRLEGRVQERERVAQVLFRALARGDIAIVDDNRPDRGIVEAVHRHRFQRPPSAVLVLRPQLGLHPVAGLLAQLGEHGEGLGSVVGMDQLEGVAAHVLGGAVAEHRLARLARIQHRAVRAEQRDDVAGVFHEGAEALFARPERRGVGVAVRGRGVGGNGHGGGGQYSPGGCPRATPPGVPGRSRAPWL